MSVLTMNGKAHLLPACTFVVPCRNEGRTLALVLSEIQSLQPQFQDIEIIVVDNNSDDDTSDIARAMGALVVECPVRGYGIALRTGIEQAHHELVVVMDGDNSYDASESVYLIQTLLRTNAQLVVGNRLYGRMEPGAMPFTHRWVGTPLLSLLITLFHRFRCKTQVRDCNGGMRAFYKSVFLTWNLRSTGMELASEMIIRALRADARYCEVPISYRRSIPGSVPHLRPFRDGCRHLQQILSLMVLGK